MYRYRGERNLFNIIITHLPGYSNFIATKAQLRDILGDDFIIVDSRQSIIFGRVSEPYKAIDILARSLSSTTPILKIIPVDEVTDARLESIIESVKKLCVKIPVSASFAIRIHGHPYRIVEGEYVRLHRDEAIREIAEYIDRKVNLSNPEWIIYIRITKLYGATELAAITVAPSDKIISVQKLSRVRT